MHEFFGEERRVANDEARRTRRGRQPLPATTRGETLSCYIPRWAVERLQELADGEQLSRNMVVRRILLEYLAPEGTPGRGIGGGMTGGRG